MDQLTIRARSGIENNYEGRFEMSSNKSQGYTIGERLSIVLRNENNFACIRMSSNWFAASAWYYLNLYFDVQPFDIKELDWIT